MLVVDTSAVLAALLGRPAGEGLVTRLREDGDLHAPHLLDVEALHALRRLVLTGALTPERAEEALADLAELALTRYPHQPLVERIWQLRANLTAYDASFVALAEALQVPLVTCDGRLASSAAGRATIELFATA